MSLRSFLEEKRQTTRDGRERLGVCLISEEERERKRRLVPFDSDACIASDSADAGVVVEKTRSLGSDRKRDLQSTMDEEARIRKRDGSFVRILLVCFVGTSR